MHKFFVYMIPPLNTSCLTYPFNLHNIHRDRKKRIFVLSFSLGGEYLTQINLEKLGEWLKKFCVCKKEIFLITPFGIELKSFASARLIVWKNICHALKINESSWVRMEKKNNEHVFGINELVNKESGEAKNYIFKQNAQLSLSRL